MRKLLIALALGLITVVSINAVLLDHAITVKSDAVAETLYALGEPKPEHFMENITPELIKQGEEIVTEGKTKGGTYVSKYFVCTSCHNIEMEDPELWKSDPQARLLYAKENDIPFLQGTTFYGIVNRETWYNDDYVKKYGSLVEPARHSLKNAIQLCSKECSQGRYLEDWELNAVLAYLWSLEYDFSDIRATDELKSRISANDGDKVQLIKDIKKYYLLKSPATFPGLPKDKAVGYEGFEGDPENGKLVYELSCQQCHKSRGVASVVFDDSKSTFKMFENNITKNTDLSIYEIIQHGTYPYKGHKAYMPLYPEQRMNKQMIEDLRAYIEQEAR
jgi:mono/diheme cytochrome c family protein